MKEQELCKKRLIDLSNQANQKGIVTFSDFLNLNEQNIYHSNQKEYYTSSKLYGGYDSAERQIVAFIPDALCYDWDYPIVCLKLSPMYPKYAEELSHRDVLGALMNLGIERSVLGDIVPKEHNFYVFCDDGIASFIKENLSKIRHTLINVEVMDSLVNLNVEPEFEEKTEMVASNRIDAIIARAYKLSRSESAEYLMNERVFVNGRTITNCNHSITSGSIVSVRGKGRFIFETNNGLSKKGRLIVKFLFYK